MNTPSQFSTDGRQASRTTEASGATPRLSEHGRAKARDAVEGLRESAAGTAERIADSVDAAASELDGSEVGQLSGYIHELADKMGGLSRDLREKSGDDMLRQVTRLARENPALFLTTSVAAGFALSRFARASRPEPGDASRLPLPRDEARVQLGADTRADRQATPSFKGGMNS